MKTLKIKGITYQYKVIRTIDVNNFTIFYLGEMEYTRRKYFLFGEKITIRVPIEVFRVGMDIESASYSKKDVEDRLLQKITYLKREEEIKKGEII